MELYPCLFEKFLNSIDLDLDPYQFINLTNLTVNTFINIYLLSISFYTEIPLNLLLDISSNKINDNLLRKTFWQNIEKYNYLL